MLNVRTLLLLLLAYGLAAGLPEPGLAMNRFQLAPGWPRLPQFLLGTMLFCAGLCSSRDTLLSMQVSRHLFVVASLATWILPIGAWIVAVLILWGCCGCPAAVAAGLCVVVAMPVATSTVGWSSLTGGSVGLSIGLLIAATAAAPLVTPVLVDTGVSLVGEPMSDLEQASAEPPLVAGDQRTSAPWRGQGMSLFVFGWVLTPVLLGSLIASRLSQASHQRVKANARRLSFMMLVLLNYVNASTCLPPLTEHPRLLLWPAVGCVTLLGLAHGATYWFSRVLHCWPAAPGCSDPPGLVPAALLKSPCQSLPQPEYSSLLLASCMRNTGAALVFAGVALADYGLISITIIAYTLVQHLWAGICFSRPAAVHPPGFALDGVAGVTDR